MLAEIQAPPACALVPDSCPCPQPSAVLPCSGRPGAVRQDGLGCARGYNLDMADDDQISPTTQPVASGGVGEVSSDRYPGEDGLTAVERGNLARVTCEAWSLELRRDMLGVLREGLAVKSVRQAFAMAESLAGSPDPRARANAGRLYASVARLAGALVTASERAAAEERANKTVNILNDNRVMVLDPRRAEEVEAGRAEIRRAFIEAIKGPTAGSKPVEALPHAGDNGRSPPR